MNNYASKALAVALTIFMFLSFFAVLPVRAFVGPVSFIEPQTILSDSNDATTFDVNLTIANITGVVGMQFEVTWDTSVLAGVGGSMVEVFYDTVTPAPYQGNIWQLQKQVTASVARYSFTWQNLTDMFVNGYGPVNVTTTDFPPDGKQTVFTITLQWTREPTQVEGYIDSPIEITTSNIGDAGASPISHVAHDGYARRDWAAPSTCPYYSVQPSTYEATDLYEVFNISIWIHNLDPGWEAVGFEFKLGYHPAILDLVGCYEGPWLPPFGASPNQGTSFMCFDEPTYVVVGDLVLPDVNGTWHAPYPGGSGVLAVLEFNATQQGILPDILSCDLDLYDTKVANWLADPVCQEEPQDGFYSIRPKALGRAIDIYTQYPDPYGGQGPNNPSDLFWPQKEVCLYAYVTYNEWPEQNKDVAFEVKDPYGVPFTVLFGRTDSMGIAEVCFRLPWMCDDPEYYFGEWFVIGTVDVACEIVNDTLTFKYDYQARIFKVTTDAGAYAHCNYTEITVEYGSAAMQTYDGILTVTVMDETGVPFGFVYVNVTVGGAEYCSYANGTDTVVVHIVKWARAGIGEIHVGILDDFPQHGGGVMNGPFDSTLITILAEWA
jgi:hypothetical protein